MPRLTPDDVLRWHETKKRLIADGWKFVEDQTGPTCYVRASHFVRGGTLGSGPNYETALTEALKSASRINSGFSPKALNSDGE
jgi:hypothetical protein